MPEPTTLSAKDQDELSFLLDLFEKGGKSSRAMPETQYARMAELMRRDTPSIASSISVPSDQELTSELERRVQNRWTSGRDLEAYKAWEASRSGLRNARNDGVGDGTPESRRVSVARTNEFSRSRYSGSAPYGMTDVDVDDESSVRSDATVRGNREFRERRDQLRREHHSAVENWKHHATAMARYEARALELRFQMNELNMSCDDTGDEDLNSISGSGGGGSGHRKTRRGKKGKERVPAAGSLIDLGTVLNPAGLALLLVSIQVFPISRFNATKFDNLEPVFASWQVGKVRSPFAAVLE
ncbi:hypothetical protein G7046_g7065 [Stylonectria norvegica]|nr:hypothetical protein G7046_g7065 [Stylonectria norvegica]